MKTYRWLFAAALIVAVAAGCGLKGSDGHMGGSSISTERLDVDVFGKGDTAKYCPVSGDAIASGKGYLYKLKDGKKIMLCCPSCVSEVEKNEAKYGTFLY
jgi:hypothetical protein